MSSAPQTPNKRRAKDNGLDQKRKKTETTTTATASTTAVTVSATTTSASPITSSSSSQMHKTLVTASEKVLLEIKTLLCLIFQCLTL
jgi:hypothetical protein